MNKDLSSSGFITEGELADEETIIELKKIHTSTSGFNELWEFRRLGKLHVLKCLQPIYRNDPFYKKLLKKEFDIAYQLEHIHICRTLGWEKHETQGDCILMEFIDGETLESFIEKSRLTTDLAIKFINELCDALQYIHSKQVIHRDLKPANILITHNGNNVKLIDFGLSDGDDYHILKIPAGTRQYIAPEQMQKDVRIDARADIYSLGVIILEMGRQLNNRHLMTVARKCLIKNRERRFASVADLRKAINTKSHRKRYYFTGVVIGTLIAIAAILFFFSYNKIRKYLPEALGTEESYSNYVVTNHYQQVLLNENRVDKDSLSAIKAIEEVLKVQFPMATQRQTAIYSNVLFHNTQEILPR